MANLLKMIVFDDSKTSTKNKLIGGFMILVGMCVINYAFGIVVGSIINIGVLTSLIGYSVYSYTPNIKGVGA